MLSGCRIIVVSLYGISVLLVVIFVFLGWVLCFVGAGACGCGRVVVEEEGGGF